jgi:hypothetical protein
MSLLRRSLVLLSFGLVATCQSAGVSLVWAQTQADQGYNDKPTASAIDHKTSILFYDVAVYGIPASSVSPYHSLVQSWSRNTPRPSLQWSSAEAKIPLSLSTGRTGLETFQLSKLVTSMGSKVAFDFSYTSINAVPYVYNTTVQGNDSPLAIGDDPYNLVSACNIQSASGRSLTVLEAARISPAGTPPSVLTSDTRLNASSAFFLGNKIFAVGNDNDSSLARGGARASVYSIGGTPYASFTVSPAFSIATHNTFDAGTSTTTGYQNLWGAADTSHYYLVTNKTVSHSGTYQRSFTIKFVNSTGGVIWTSQPAPGLVAEISVGGTNDIYVRGIHGSGDSQFLASYNQYGNQRWVKNLPVSNIAAALSSGVIMGDSEIDGSGHHHPHITKYSQSGGLLWSQTHLAGMPSDDDYLYHLLWYKGSIFIDGQTVPVVGNKTVFGAQYTQQYVWDLTTSFSTATNPNAPWSYGSSTSQGQFALFTNNALVGQWYSNPSNGNLKISGWSNDSFAWPNVAINRNGNNIDYWTNGSVLLQPQNGQSSVVRFTDPLAGQSQLTVTASFTRIESSANTSTYSILVNGNQVYSGTLDSAGQKVTKSWTGSLAQGQTVDFVAGYIDGGSQGNGAGLMLTANIKSP